MLSLGLLRRARLFALRRHLGIRIIISNQMSSISLTKKPRVKRMFIDFDPVTGKTNNS